MGGYTIEFNGHEVENKDVAEIVATSSLEKTVVVTAREPASGDYNGAFYYWQESSTGVIEYLVWNNVYVTQGLDGYTYHRGVVYQELTSKWYGIARTGPTNVQTPITSITPSTDTEGIQNTGGISLVTEVESIQAGSVASSGSAQKMELTANDGSEIGKTKYLPPATSGDDSDINASYSTIFTPTTTDLTVTASGFGNGHLLNKELTKLIVEEI